MGKRIQVTFDAADPHRLAGWWAEVLGYQVEDGHDFISGLLESGTISESDVVVIDQRFFFADAVAANDPDGLGPRLYFQRVPEPKAGKNRIHLDVPVPPDELDQEVERLAGAGALLVEYRSHPGHRWAVMQDPEGNEFCLH